MDEDWSGALAVDASLDRQSLENDIAQIRGLCLDTTETQELSESSEDEDDEDNRSVDNDTDAGETNGLPDSLSLDDLAQLPVNLDNCLFLNQLYQEFISESIERLEGLLSQNRQQQKLIQDELNNVMTKKRKSYLTSRNQRAKFLTIFASPYFKDKKGFAQPNNEDTKTKLAQQEIDLYMKPPRMWSPDEKELLRKAVRETALEHMLQPFMTRKELLCEKLANDNYSDEERDAINARIEETNAEMEQTKLLSDLELFGPRDQEHDWMKIGNIDFDGGRSAEECELMWKNYLHPSVSKARWTRDEEANLRDLVAKYHNDWKTIAKELKTNRTDHQCMEHYQSEVNDELLRTKWTPEEDQLLLQVVESCRLGDFIPWHQVSYYMEGRTRDQVYRRWLSHLCPDLAKGKWSLKEDMLLIAGVIRYGCKWSKIAKLIPGRQGLKCRDRYLNSLDPAILFASWTREDDEKLMQLYSSMGPKWSEIARYIPGRTDSMVAVRYRRLLAAGDEWRSIPCNTQPGRCSNYRRHVFLKVLDLTNVTKEKYLSTVSRGQPDFSWVLKAIPPNEADRIIERLQRNINKPTLKPGAKCLVLSEQDKEFINYFNVVVTPKPAGRPYAEVRVDEKSEVYISAAAVQLKALGSEVTPSTTSSTPTFPFHFGSPSVTLLPPTSSTLNAFKALLLSRREFQNGTLLKPTVECTRSPAAKRLKTGDEQQPCNSNKLPLPFVNGDVHYSTLAARFASLFVWPALLSTLQPPKEVEPTPKERRKKPSNSVRSATKRKYRKPWVGQRMRELSRRRWMNKCQNDDDSSNNPTSPKSDAPSQAATPENGTTPKRRRGRPKGCKIVKKYVDPTPVRQSVRQRKPTFKVEN